MLEFGPLRSSLRPVWLAQLLLERVLEGRKDRLRTRRFSFQPEARELGLKHLPSQAVPGFLADQQLDKGQSLLFVGRFRQ
jgi:hypothetical protein